MIKPLPLVAIFFFFTLQAWACPPAQAPLNEPFDASQANENSADNYLQISGVYPHLTMRNNEKECGTGAIVPWQGDLWAITYGPHKPNGSSDKLYQITPDLSQIVFPESVGGTPANRMIHRETNQLLIGPYLIDSEKQIRTIPPSQMYGRLTGTARHMSSQAKSQIMNSQKASALTGFERSASIRQRRPLFSNTSRSLESS